MEISDQAVARARKNAELNGLTGKIGKPQDDPRHFTTTWDIATNGDGWQVADELSRRLTRIFLAGPDGGRPAYGGTEVFRTDPHWKDLLLFHEYFNGDDGAGLGASHQTGWTGLVAKLLQQAGDGRPE